MRYRNGHEFKYMGLRPSQINVDLLYQRPLNKKRVEQIVREFNGDTFNEPKVSYRDGKYWVYDGQHSIAAWRELFNGEDKTMLCKVYTGMTWLDECEAFIRQNGIVVDPTTNDKLSAAYNARRADVVAMVDGVKLAGMGVSFKANKCRGMIVATGALFRAYNLLGMDAYVDMLTAMREAWNGQEDSLNGIMISGMAKFYNAFYGNFNRESLVRSLAKVRPADIIREGKASRSGNGYAKEIAKVYNNKRRTHRLDVNTL